MDFRLPEYQKFPKEIEESLRRQLRFSGPLVTGCQVLVGAIFPIAEGIFINLATDAEPNKATPYIVILVIIGIIHILIFFWLLFLEKPLPQFLIQFDEQARAIEQLEAESETYELYSTTFIDANTATQFSMNEIELIRTEAETEITNIFERVLYYWIERRTEIFWFRDGDALYNFAVYLQAEPNILRVSYRNHDDRIIPSNREWRAGDGHVGASFLQGKTLTWSIPTGQPIPDALKSSQYRDEDRQYYNSMIATPIIRNGQPVGVFVITSSKPEQFETSLHTRIVEVISILLAQSMDIIGGDAP